MVGFLYIYRIMKWQADLRCFDVPQTTDLLVFRQKVGDSFMGRRLMAVKGRVGAALRVGVGAADCDNQPEIVPNTHPPRGSVYPMALRS